MTMAGPEKPTRSPNWEPVEKSTPARGYPFPKVFWSPDLGTRRVAKTELPLDIAEALLAIDADVDALSGGSVGGGIPSGGNTGESLVKASDLAGDVEWKLVDGGGGTNLPPGADGKLLGHDATGPVWVDPPDHELPASSKPGDEYLSTDINGNAVWKEVPDPVEGVPDGANPNDYLQANSNGDAIWAPKPDELPAGGAAGEFLGVTGTGARMWLPLDIPDALPAGGAAGDALVLVEQPDGSLKPEWQAPPAAEQPEGWKELSRGMFQLDSNTVSSGVVHRPTDVGVVHGHGVINNFPVGPPPTYWLAETPDAAGDSKLHTVDGDEFILSDPNAQDHRVTAIVDGTEYPVVLSPGTLAVSDSDGSSVVDVPAWAFTAVGLPTVAPQTVEIVVEAFGGSSGSGGGTACFATYGEQEAAIDAGDCNGGGGSSADLTDILARLQALEDHHQGTLADHVPTYGGTP